MRVSRTGVLAFALASPVSWYLGVTFVLGHARIVPYWGVAADRVLFAAVALGIPLGIAALASRRSRRRGASA